MERLIFPAKLENLEKMFAFIREAAARQGFAPEMIDKIQLACEEALVNVINYAYPGKDGELEITYFNSENFLEIGINDSGVPFNPFSLPDPDILAPIDARRIGGLGIFMIKKIMDEARYKREKGRNMLVLVKYNVCRIGKQNMAAKKEPLPAGAWRWPLDFMKKEEFKKGDVIFKAGDKADRMFYIAKGVLRLVEINKTITAGDVIGEMGVFSPFKERTASAVCAEDLETYTMGKD
ncbi:MAG: ATP-binding protein, partial [Planctomycetota bacterium]